MPATNLPALGWDTETWLIQPGRSAPRMVCLSWWDDTAEDGAGAGGVLDREAGLEWALGHLRSRAVLLIAHNLSFDLGILVANGPRDTMALVWAALQKGRVADTMVREHLRKIAKGWSDFDPRVGKKPSYHLNVLVDEYLGEVMEGKAGEDAWRLRYNELDGVPISDWPPEAYTYALLDARYCLRVWRRQERGEPVFNQDEQYLAAWALHLMGAWGMRTDGAAVEALEAKLRKHVDAELVKLEAIGFYRWEGTRKEPRRKLVRNTAVVQERVEAAYKARAYKEWAEAGKGSVRYYVVPTKGERLELEEDEDYVTPWGASAILPLAHLPGAPEVWATPVDEPIPGRRCIPVVNDGQDGQGCPLDKIPFFAPLTDGGKEKMADGAPWSVKFVGTSAEVLRESGDPDLILLASIAKDQKLLTTYVPILKSGAVLPINPRWNVLVASGRTSCSKPNMQNPPRKGGVRECFVPRAGFWFMAADYHIAELCSLAQVLVDLFGLHASRMADALRSGRELHLETAAGLLGCSYEEAVARYKAGDKEAKDARQLSKALNFGAPGGLGAASFVDYVKTSTDGKVILSEARAKELLDAWKERYPEMRRYFRTINDRLQAEGGRFTLKQHRSDRLRGGVGYCDGCNSYFQGLTADGAKAALVAVSLECYTGAPYTADLDALLDRGWDGTAEGLAAVGVEVSPLYGCRPVAFVHDEIILEVPADYAIARPAAKRLEVIMQAEMSRYTPDIPCKADAHLMARWFKNAEPTYNEAGELILWQPEEAKP